MKMILFHLVWVRPGDIRDGLAPTQVFNAVPSSAFSAPAELAPLFIDIARKPLAPLGLSVCPVQAQTSSAPRGSLEGRFRKAKPSMVAPALPNSALEPADIKWKRTLKINSKPNSQLQAGFLILAGEAFWRAFSPSNFSGFIPAGGSKS